MKFRVEDWRGGRGVQRQERMTQARTNTAHSVPCHHISSRTYARKQAGPLANNLGPRWHRKISQSALLSHPHEGFSCVGIACMTHTAPIRIRMLSSSRFDSSRIDSIAYTHTHTHTHTHTISPPMVRVNRERSKWGAPSTINCQPVPTTERQKQK